MMRMSSLMLALASIVCAGPKDDAPSQKMSDILDRLVGLAVEEGARGLIRFI